MVGFLSAELPTTLYVIVGEYFLFSGVLSSSWRRSGTLGCCETSAQHFRDLRALTSQMPSAFLLILKHAEMGLQEFQPESCRYEGSILSVKNCSPHALLAFLEKLLQ